MSDFETEAVRLGLTKMFNQGWFDICAVKECLEVAHVVPPKATLQSLQPLHCVPYSEMSPEFREELVRRVLGLFNYPFKVEIIAKKLLPPPPPPPPPPAPIVTERPKARRPWLLFGLRRKS